MHFGEYELSPSLIGLSLLHSAHPEAFQRLLVRASIPCYRDFTLAKCRSLGFASASADYTPSSGSLSLRLGVSWHSTSPATATRRFIMQKARRHPNNGAPTACGRMVSGTLSLPCQGCFSPFPHGTCSLSVSREYLALPDGPGGFAQGSSCPALLRIPLGPVGLRVPDYHRLWSDFPDTFRSPQGCHTVVLLPRGGAWHTPRFGLFPGRSPLLGESLLFSFPAGTKMFQFPALASPTYRGDGRPSACRVVPFGCPRVNGYLPLTADFRSLSRPSSPP